MGKDRTRIAAFAVTVAAIAMIAMPGPAAAFDVQVFAPNVYSANTAAMDAALGIQGLTTEDFEDLSLAPGLQVATSTPDSGPRVLLPQLYFDGSGYFAENSWAGLGALVNTTDNVVWCSPALCDLSRIAARVTFTVPGVRRFGVGLGNFQGDLRDHAVLVNGVEVVPLLESLPGFVSGINVRNGYLVVSAEPGETIGSVSIEVRANGSNEPVCCETGDGLIFDHVAFGNPAELSALTLSSVSVAGCKSVTGRVTLSAPAPAGGRVVTVADTLASLTAPITVSVPAGAITKTFAMKTFPVLAIESGTVSATLDSTTLETALSVRPIGMQSVGLTPTNVVGSNTAVGKATLECPAGPGSITVDLASSNSAVASPVAASIVVPQGLRSATFDIATIPVLAKTTATISGTANGIKKSKILTVSVASVVTPTSLKFGSVAAGTTSAPLNATLTNEGGEAFSVDSITLTGTAASWFVQMSNCPASLAPGASCTISVTFTPLAAASKSAKLAIATSATSTPVNVSLSGTGL